MKQCIVLFALLLTGGFISAQNNNTIKTQQSMDDNAAMDKEFVTKAAQSGKAEVMLGNLAESRASSQMVKDYGKMMVMDHQKANDELTTLAARRRYMTVATELPADMQKDYEKLSAKTGVDFDKAFMEQMVKDHEKAVKLFRKEAENGNDPEMKSWAAKMLPALEQHLQHAKDMHQQIKDYKKMTDGNNGNNKNNNPDRNMNRQ